MCLFRLQPVYLLLHFGKLCHFMYYFACTVIICILKQLIKDVSSTKYAIFIASLVSNLTL